MSWRRLSLPFFVLLLAPFVVLGVISAMRWLAITRALWYCETVGTVLADFTPVEQSAYNRLTWQGEAHYQFEVDGRTLSGGPIFADHSPLTQANELAHWRALLRAGTRIRVFYSEHDPAESCLAQRADPDLALVAMLSIPAIAMWLCLLFRVVSTWLCTKDEGETQSATWRDWAFDVAHWLQAVCGIIAVSMFFAMFPAGMVSKTDLGVMDARDHSKLVVAVWGCSAVVAIAGLALWSWYRRPRAAVSGDGD